MMRRWGERPRKEVKIQKERAREWLGRSGDFDVKRLGKERGLSRGERVGRRGERERRTEVKVGKQKRRVGG
jgi:hypothetical protein